MTTNWPDVTQKLQSYHAGIHTIRPPCARSRIAATERQLGKLPGELLAMLEHFNGAILFDKSAGGELVTLRSAVTPWTSCCSPAARST
jgi:hypothetical protein